MMKMIKSVHILSVFICALLLIQGCEKQDALDQFIQLFSDENRVNSFIIPSIYGDGDMFKINLQDETEPDNILSKACENVDVESELAIYRNELDTTKQSFENILSTLSYEKIDEPELDDVNIILMLESKNESDIMTFVLYDNNTFLINDNSTRNFYSIENEKANELVQVYEQFYDYYVYEETSPCWVEEWLELIESNTNK